MWCPSSGKIARMPFHVFEHQENCSSSWEHPPVKETTECEVDITVIFKWEIVLSDEVKPLTNSWHVLKPHRVVLDSMRHQSKPACLVYRNWLRPVVRRGKSSLLFVEDDFLLHGAAVRDRDLSLPRPSAAGLLL